MVFRSDNRAFDQIRPVTIFPDFIHTAEGSTLIEVGNTRVICTASVEEAVPTFLRNSGKGWVSSEYGMLPRATLTRTPREVSKGRASGRTHEIQRLIGRSLRAVTDLEKLGERTAWIDRDAPPTRRGGPPARLRPRQHRRHRPWRSSPRPGLRRRLPRRRRHELRYDRRPQDGRG